MAVFGKRPAAQQPVVPSAPPVPPPPAPLANPTAKNFTVIVTASAVHAAREGTDHYRLVQAVIDFVNAMMGNMHYTRAEIEPKALQVFHADFYLAQVNNGGHSQFIHNAGRNAEFAFRDAFEGLKGMAAPHAVILEDMVEWVMQNPSHAKAQDGFETRAPFLDTLDNAFYDMNKRDDMIKRSATWILTWPELKVVADQDYVQEMQKLGGANKKYADRALYKTVQSVVFKTQDRFQVAIGMLLTSLPSPEFLLKMGAGRYMDFNGKQEMAVEIESDKGKRLVVLEDNDGGVRLYEYFNPDQEKLQELTRTAGLEKSFEFHNSPDYRPPRVGGLMTGLNSKAIAEVIQQSIDANAGGAIAYFLHKLGALEAFAAIGAHSSKDIQDAPRGKKMITWYVTTGKNKLIVGTSEFGHAVFLNAQSPNDLPRCEAKDVAAFMGHCVESTSV